MFLYIYTLDESHLFQTCVKRVSVAVNQFVGGWRPRRKQRLMDHPVYVCDFSARLFPRWDWLSKRGGGCDDDAGDGKHFFFRHGRLRDFDKDGVKSKRKSPAGISITGVRVGGGECRGIKNHLSRAPARKSVFADSAGLSVLRYSIKRPVKLNVNTRDY